MNIKLSQHYLLAREASECARPDLLQRSVDSAAARRAPRRHSPGDAHRPGHPGESALVMATLCAAIAAALALIF